MVRALNKMTKAGRPEKSCYGNIYPKSILFKKPAINLNENIKTLLLIIKLISNTYKIKISVNLLFLEDYLIMSFKHQ